MEKTFSLQDSLPSLPVAELDGALKKYLDSVEVVTSPEEYERTKRIVSDFQKGEGQLLYNAVVEKAKSSRNWIEQWWEEKAYLELRVPIFPLINFGGPSPDLINLSPVMGSQLERSAMVIYLTMKYWELVRTEKLSITKNRNIPWCMNQDTQLFNSCRIPGKYVDKRVSYFKTVSEGDCPSHVVIICRGHFWKLETWNSAINSFYTPAQIVSALQHVRNESKMAVPCVNSLTTADRTAWFEARERLLSLSKSNGGHLKTIEKAVFCLALTDEVLNNESDLTNFSMVGDPRCQWADKCLTYHFHLNGLSGVSCDHTGMDAIVLTRLIQWTNVQTKKMGWVWNGDPVSYPIPAMNELQFVMNGRILGSIVKAENYCRAVCSDVCIFTTHFYEYANELFRKVKIYGDTVVQLAIQLAYYKIHRKPASTYETAATRQFYHGRTETVRSCTKEALKWSKIMTDQYSTVDQKSDAFRRAMDKHNYLLLEASNGQGCDRLLLGLRTMAKELGRPDPDLFLDPSWLKSGGDANFVISTSFVGYSMAYGGVLAMHKHGYGIYYKIEPHRITFFMTGYLSSNKTNVDLFCQELFSALRSIHPLLLKIGPKSKM